jgi:segregation and condensation protein B
MEALEAALQENFDKAAAPASRDDEPGTSPVEVPIHDHAIAATIDAAPGLQNEEANDESN